MCQNSFALLLKSSRPSGLAQAIMEVARAICYGQRGEIRKRYREGKEAQLGTLGLVTNVVVL